LAHHLDHDCFLRHEDLRLALLAEQPTSLCGDELLNRRLDVCGEGVGLEEVYRQRSDELLCALELSLP
jgi:hypothetical protein